MVGRNHFSVLAEFSVLGPRAVLFLEGGGLLFWIIVSMASLRSALIGYELSARMEFPIDDRRLIPGIAERRPYWPSGFCNRVWWFADE